MTLDERIAAWETDEHPFRGLADLIARDRARGENIEMLTQALWLIEQYPSTDAYPEDDSVAVDYLVETARDALARLAEMEQAT